MDNQISMDICMWARRVSKISVSFTCILMYCFYIYLYISCVGYISFCISALYFRTFSDIFLYFRILGISMETSVDMQIFTDIFTDICM